MAENTVKINTKNVPCTQNVKGSDEVKYSAVLSGVPATWADYVTFAGDNPIIQSTFMADLESAGRSKVLGRLHSLATKDEELFETIGYHEVCTTTQTSLTSAKMVEVKTIKMAELANAIDLALDEDDFEAAKKFTAERKLVAKDLAAWTEKRESERIAKNETRKVNAQKKEK